MKVASLSTTPNCSTQSDSCASVNLSSAVASAVPRASSIRMPAFRSLFALAENTANQLRGTKNNPDRIKDKTYDNYTRFPHSREDILRMREQRNETQYRKSVEALAILSDTYADSVTIFLQSNYSRECETPREALQRREVRTDRPELLHEVFRNPYVIHPLRSSAVSAADKDGIESRLSITVKPEYADLLAEVLVEFCSADREGLHSAKVMGPIDHGARSETGILYLSQTDPEIAAVFAECIHKNLESKVRMLLDKSDSEPHQNGNDSWLKQARMDISAGTFYTGAPPGTQPVRPGIAYSEKPPAFEKEISSGRAKSETISFAIDDHLNFQEDLESALLEHLDACGYSTINPAFAYRDGDTPQAIQERVDLLQKLTPEQFKEEKSLPPSPREEGNPERERERFTRLFLDG
ncbi:MAG TPA: T3SS effector HopA1 family protein [Noviherbaspirillum sp.]|nr:T3SS effector HopA1 family protein [Noviherbaspirillum sp.]